MIVFKTLRYKNFMSFGNSFNEIELTKTQNTCVLGFNGSGKSASLLDPLTFALYGKPFRKITKGNLVNSINKSDCIVELEFSIGTSDYKIIRGIKPNIFEIYCNTILINQDASVKDYQEQLERYILKMDYKSFTQVVILGAAKYNSFMQLSAADRRTIIEDLLDIQIFSSMNAIAKENISELKSKILDCKYNIDLLQDKIELQKENIEKNKKSSDEIILTKKELISNSYSEIIYLQKDIDTIITENEKLKSEISDFLQLEKKKSKLVLIEDKIKTNITALEKDNHFYENHDDCPTCRQSICSDFKDKTVNTNSKKLTELNQGKDKLKIELNQVKERLKEISLINIKLSKNNNELSRLNSSISSVQKYITIVKKEIENLSTEKKDDGSDKLRNFQDSLSKYNTDYRSYTEEKSYYDFIAIMLKDGGIKTKIIKQYLPILNKYINEYLTKLNFFVNFNIDENFNEVIKSRYRDEFTYNSFSEGQKTRIDLAVLFAFRQLARIKNSVNCNLLILDEILESSLDADGTDTIIDILTEGDKNTNVFVISHKTDQISSKFDRILSFELVKNFSKMKEIL